MGWLYIWILLCHACTSFARRYCAMATPPWHEAYNYTWGEQMARKFWGFYCKHLAMQTNCISHCPLPGVGRITSKRGKRGGDAPLEGDRGRASGVKRGGFGGWGKSEIHLTTGSSIFNQIFCNTRGDIYVASITTMRVIYDTGVRIPSWSWKPYKNSKLSEALVKLPATLSIEWSLMGRWASRLVNLANHPKSHLSDQH